MDDCHAVALVGNPGTGKSTLLNGLIGKSVFLAGHSSGTGLTTKIQDHEEGSITFFDTPGLDDISTRAQAGKELNQLLRQNKNIKIAFVITLEGGRLRRSDIATMDVILDAISVDTNNRFGIIINKMTEREFSTVHNSAHEKFNLQALVASEKLNTSHWCFVRDYAELRDAENDMLISTDVVKLFRGLPVTKMKDASVKDIDTDTYEEIMYKLEEEHKRRMKQLKLMASIIFLLGTGTVGLNMVASQVWLFKVCRDLASVAWISQQLPILIDLLEESGEINIRNSTAGNITSSFYSWATSKLTTFVSENIPTTLESQLSNFSFIDIMDEGLSSALNAASDFFEINSTTNFSLRATVEEGLTLLANVSSTIVESKGFQDTVDTIEEGFSYVSKFAFNVSSTIVKSTTFKSSVSKMKEGVRWGGQQIFRLLNETQI